MTHIRSWPRICTNVTEESFVRACSNHPSAFFQHSLLKLADSAGLLQKQNMGADIGEEVEE